MIPIKKLPRGGEGGHTVALEGSALETHEGEVEGVRVREALEESTFSVRSHSMVISYLRFPRSKKRLSRARCICS